MNAPSNLHGPLRRELIAVLAYVNRGAARSKRGAHDSGNAELNLDRLVNASRMQ